MKPIRAEIVSQQFDPVTQVLTLKLNGSPALAASWQIMANTAFVRSGAINNPIAVLNAEPAPRPKVQKVKRARKGGKS